MFDESAIYTDDIGRPIPKPAREDYASAYEYALAKQAWRDRITSTANQAFDEAWQHEMSSAKRKRVIR